VFYLKETRKNILFLWWPEIPQGLHTTPKYLKLCSIEHDSTAITHLFSLFLKAMPGMNKIAKRK